jgi:hypothetical protein
VSHAGQFVAVCALAESFWKRPRVRSAMPWSFAAQLRYYKHIAGMFIQSLEASKEGKLLLCHRISWRRIPTFPFYTAAALTILEGVAGNDGWRTEVLRRT